MLDSIQWFATLTGITGAIMVSANLGRRPTGFGFVVFTGSSVAWIIAGLMDNENSLVVQNGVLTAVNLFGIYRWLILKKPG